MKQKQTCFIIKNNIFCLKSVDSYRLYMLNYRSRRQQAMDDK
jgi:hypothetical protein